MPGFLASLASMAKLISAMSGTVEKVVMAPSRASRAPKSTLCCTVSSVTKRRLTSSGSDTEKPRSEGHLAPYRSASMPTQGEMKPGMNMQKITRPAAVDDQGGGAGAGGGTAGS